jgi:large subunit ribosomal protein L32
MAKHPVPKRKSSKERSHRRAASNETRTLKKLTAMSRTVACTKCQQPRLSHTACPTCGTYRGRVVVDLAAKAAKVKKVQA